MHGNINFVWNKIKDKEKFPHVFHKQLYLHGIFPSIDRKKHLIYRGRDLSTEEGTCLQRARLIYGWGGLSKEG
jgi:hypothetical protein